MRIFEYFCINIVNVILNHSYMKCYGNRVLMKIKIIYLCVLRGQKIINLFIGYSELDHNLKRD